MRLKRLSCALLVSLMAALCAASQEKSLSSTNTHRIAVLVLDGNSGKPVKRAWVGLRGVGQSAETNWRRSVRSNSQGLAEFSLPDPIPEKVALSFDLNAFSPCSEAGFLTERILNVGIVAGDFCAAANVYSSHPPLAGQLVMYGRGVTTWDRICQGIAFLSLFR
jgi:hypothetical protein